MTRWLVATIFTLQTVLLSAAAPCDCAPMVQAPQVDECCGEEGHLLQPVRPA